MAENPQLPEEQDMQEKLFQAQKFYLKDVSFESPNSPSVFTADWDPQLDLDLSSSAKGVGEDLYEVVVKLTVTVKSEDTTAYLAEVHQAGVFTIKGMDPQELEVAHQIHCMSMLYPYACATLSDLIGKGGFPQLLLSPMDFGSSYRKRKQTTEQPQGDGAG